MIKLANNLVQVGRATACLPDPVRLLTKYRMISPTVPTSTENLVPGTIHWSSKVQVRGTEEEAIRLGSRPGARSRNRERRPIYILDKLVDGRFLVL